MIEACGSCARTRRRFSGRADVGRLLSLPHPPTLRPVLPSVAASADSNVDTRTSHHQQPSGPTAKAGVRCAHPQSAVLVASQPITGTRLGSTGRLPRRPHVTPAVGTCDRYPDSRGDWVPYNISKNLIKRLPSEEQGTQESIGKQLLDKSGGLCSLCDGPLKVASEVLEADHTEAEAGGGPTTLANLDLAHQDCNRTKRDLSNAQARPYLRFRRFIREQGGRIKYDKAAQHFDIDPKPSKVEIGKTVLCDFSDGTSAEAPVHVELVAGNEIQYAFIEVPRVALLNDKDVQPRIIRHGHAFSIYNDLLRNPLHEPPSCRLGEPQEDGLRPLLMFDGQHKTVATWMADRETVVVKVYLNMDRDQANFLVNSIQAKIKKLPLSAFELSAKMADEYRAKVEEYETEMAQTGGEASESGYLKWFDAGQERNRATAALKEAWVQNVVDHPGEFRLMDHLAATGAEGADTGLTENMVKTKVIGRMLHDKPLAVSFDESTERRVQEAETITWMVNQVVDLLVVPDEESGELTPQQVEARRRLFKQGSLSYVAELLAQVYRHLTIKGGDKAMLDGTPTAEQRDAIEKAITNICGHPVWTAALDRDEMMAAVKLALERNQNVKEAFEGVALTLSYAVVGDQDAQYSQYWK